MEYNDIDKILNTALSPTKSPSKELNDKIMIRIKESGKMKYKNKHYLVAACVILCLLFIPTSIYAAYKYLLPKEAAREMDDTKLGEAFEKNGEGDIQTVTDGAYTVTYLGHVTGESISDRTASAWELHPDRTYVAVAIEKADGTEITYDDNLFVSPLIQGLKPWAYNIASMNGSYEGKIVNGVLYRIIECDSIEIFADKKLYLAVSNTTFFSKDAFNYDEVTGLITVNEDYKGTNILFDLKLDPTKADSEKVEVYLKQLEEEWNPKIDNNEMNSTNGNELASDSKGDNRRAQQEVYTDTKNGISFHIKDNDSSSWWANDINTETIFNYNFKVVGDGIESITYTLSKGEFCYYPKNNLDGLDLYGNTYNVSYEEQDKLNHSIYFKAKLEDYGYDSNYLSNLAQKDIEAREQIYYDVLNQEVESTDMRLEIKMEDGRIIEKTFSYENLLNETIQDIQTFAIVISLD